MLVSLHTTVALNELLLRISVPLENVPSWENDFSLENFHLAGRRGTEPIFLHSKRLIVL